MATGMRSGALITRCNDEMVWKMLQVSCGYESESRGHCAPNAITRLMPHVSQSTAGHTYNEAMTNTIAANAPVLNRKAVWLQRQEQASDTYFYFRFIRIYIYTSISVFFLLLLFYFLILALL